MIQCEPTRDGVTNAPHWDLEGIKVKLLKGMREGFDSVNRMKTVFEYEGHSCHDVVRW
jgi:hypothetical protein